MHMESENVVRVLNVFQNYIPSEGDSTIRCFFFYNVSFELCFVLLHSRGSRITVVSRLSVVRL